MVDVGRPCRTRHSHNAATVHGDRCEIEDFARDGRFASPDEAQIVHALGTMLLDLLSDNKSDPSIHEPASNLIRFTKAVTRVFESECERLDAKCRLAEVGADAVERAAVVAEVLEREAAVDNSVAIARGEHARLRESLTKWAKSLPEDNHRQCVECARWYNVRRVDQRFCGNRCRSRHSVRETRSRQKTEGMPRPSDRLAAPVPA